MRSILYLYNLLSFKFLVICMDRQALMTQNLGTKQENLFHENLLSMRG